LKIFTKFGPAEIVISSFQIKIKENFTEKQDVLIPIPVINASHLKNKEVRKRQIDIIRSKVTAIRSVQSRCVNLKLVMK
jgi:hypothetical protein